MVSIDIPIGDIPGRTLVEVDFALNAKDGKIYPMGFLYSCLDCKFQTKILKEMSEHQEHRNLKHKLKALLL